MSELKDFEPIENKTVEHFAIALREIRELIEVQCVPRPEADALITSAIEIANNIAIMAKTAAMVSAKISEPPGPTIPQSPPPSRR